MAHARIVQKIIDAVARARAGRGVPEAPWSRTAINAWVNASNDPRDGDQPA
jgi:hypothetical protein